MRKRMIAGLLAIAMTLNPLGLAGTTESYVYAEENTIPEIEPIPVGGLHYKQGGVVSEDTVRGYEYWTKCYSKYADYKNNRDADWLIRKVTMEDSEGVYTTEMYEISPANTNMFGGDVTIPDLVYVKGKNENKDYTMMVDKLASASFRDNTAITSVNVKSGVKIIGGKAFKGCTNLTTVTLHGTLDKLNNECFADCTKLEKIEIPQSVRVIKDKAFFNCTKLKEVVIKNASTTRAKVAMNPRSSSDYKDYFISGKTEYTLDRITTSAYDIVTENSPVSCNYAIKDSSCLRQIGSYAFYNTGITAIDIPATCFVYGDYIFGSCASLKSIKLRYDGTTGCCMVLSPHTFGGLGGGTITFELGVPVDKSNITKYVRPSITNTIDSKTKDRKVITYTVEDENGADNDGAVLADIETVDTKWAMMGSKVYDIEKDKKPTKEDMKKLTHTAVTDVKSYVYALTIPKDSTDLKASKLNRKSYSINDMTGKGSEDGTEFHSFNVATAIALTTGLRGDYSNIKFTSDALKVNYHSSTSAEDYYLWNSDRDINARLDRRDLNGTFAYRKESDYDENATHLKNIVTGYADKQQYAYINSLAGESADLKVCCDAENLTSENKLLKEESLKKELRQTKYHEIFYEDGKLTNTQFKRNGFTQIGWATTLKKALNGTVDYALGANVEVGGFTDGVLDLYAVWSEKAYTVTIDADDALGTNPSSKQTVGIGMGDTYSVLWEYAPQREGYTFVGYKDENGNEIKETDVFTLARDTTVKAMWKSSVYKIRLGLSTDSSQLKLQDVLSDDVKFIDVDTGNVSTNYEDFSFYAMYDNSYKIATYTNKDGVKHYGSYYTRDGGVANLEGYTQKSMEITSTECITEGIFDNKKADKLYHMELLGLVDNEGMLLKATDVVRVSADHRLYVQCDLTKYKISYNFNGGRKVEGVVYPETYTAEEHPDIPKPQPPTGYIFDGWFMDVDYESRSYDTEHRDTVNYVNKTDKGSARIDFTKGTYLENDSIPDTVYVASTVTDDGKYIIYDDGGSYVPLTGNRHLTAKYVADKLTVKYVLPSQIVNDEKFEESKLNQKFTKENGLYSMTVVYDNSKSNSVLDMVYADDTFVFKGWLDTKGKYVNGIGDYDDVHTSADVIVLKADMVCNCNSVEYVANVFSLGKSATTLTMDSLSDVKYESEYYTEKTVRELLGEKGNSVTDASDAKFYKNSVGKCYDLAIKGKAFTPSDITYDESKYTFVGWYMDDAYTKPYSGNTEVAGDVTLYAKFMKASYDVTVVDAGGEITTETLSCGDTVYLTDYELEKDANILDVDKPKLQSMPNGYYIYDEGWVVTENAENTAVSNSAKTLDNEVTNVVGVSYDEKGLTLHTRNGSTYGTQKATVDSKGRLVARLACTESTRLAYVYAGAGATFDGDKVDEDLYTVEYDYKKGLYVANVPKPEKAGYTFTGWNCYRGTLTTDTDVYGNTVPRIRYNMYGKFYLHSDSKNDTYVPYLRATYVKNPKEKTTVTEDNSDSMAGQGASPLPTVDPSTTPEPTKEPEVEITPEPELGSPITATDAPTVAPTQQPMVINIYYITYDYSTLQGVYDKTDTSEEVTEQNRVVTESLKLDEPKKNGFEFTGWYTDEKRTEPLGYDTIEPFMEGNTNIYANWIPTGWYTRDRLGNSEFDEVGKIVNIVLGMNEAVSDKTVQNQYIPIEAKEQGANIISVDLGEAYKYGYQFKGWYKDKEFTQPFNGVITDVNKTIDIYPKFEYVGTKYTAGQIEGKVPQTTGTPSDSKDDKPQTTGTPSDGKDDGKDDSKPQTTGKPSDGKDDDKPQTTGKPSEGKDDGKPSDGKDDATDKSDLTLKVKNKSIGIKCSFSIGAKSSKEISYESSNSTIAKVDSNGKVTGVKAGKCYITVTSGTDVKKVSVVVKKAPTYIMAISKKQVTLKKGKTSKIKYKITADCLTTVTFSTSKKKVATVDSKGVIKAKKKGKCIITLKTANGKKDKVKVTVK